MNKLINKIINQRSKISLDETSIKSYKDIIGIEEISINNLQKMFTESNSIIRSMTDNYLKYNNSILKYKKINSIQTKLLLSELNNFPSFDSKFNSSDSSIYKEIKKVNIKQELELSLDNNTKIKIFFYCSSENEKFVKNQIDRLVQLIYVFCRSFAKDLNKLNSFKIRFLMIDFPRKIKSDYTFDDLSDYGIFNNSSGYTNKHTKEMVLSRKSGLNGLLIHELIHLLDLDFHFWDHDLPNVDKFNWKKEWVQKCNMLECTKEVTSNCGYYSFTEAICNTTSSYFLSIYSGIEINMNGINKVDSKNIQSNNIDYNKIEKLATMFFVIEYIHTYINSCKLLKYFGYNSYDSFFNNTSNRKYYQNAHVFEYIVLRTFIITYYYQIIFKKLKSYINGENQNSFENYKFQKKINDFIFNKMIKKDNKNYFDYIFRIIKVDSNTDSIEYFATNFIK